ncbi:hypothetical protein BGZ82_000199 [Podila clonocystis]|nr:hypothetical protein BGZ82_000199 [Podila clonocystis]
MKCMLIVLAMIASTVSAYDCPRIPTDMVPDQPCLSVMLDAAKCNCRAFASQAGGNCYLHCGSSGGRKFTRCHDGCASDLGKEWDQCSATYNKYKEEGGGLDWAVEMGIESARMC